MGDIKDMILRMNKKVVIELVNFETEMNEQMKSFKIFSANILKKLSDLDNNQNTPLFPNTAALKKSRSSKRVIETSSSDDENDECSEIVKLHNVVPQSNEKPTKAKKASIKAENIENTSTKPKRGAAKAASENIKKVSNMKLNTKMRQPSTEENIEYNPVTIKTEKRSTVTSSKPLEKVAEKEATPKHGAPLSDVTNDNNMPPPTLKPKRGRKKVKKETEDTTPDTSAERVTRSSRLRIKEEVKTTRSTKQPQIDLSPQRKDSDVQIQEVPVTVVVLTDDSETENAADEGKNKRGKKTKKQNKMTTKIKEEKTAATLIEEPKNNTQSSIQEVSVYEDALSENKTLPDEQIKVPKVTDLNATHVIQKNSPTITNKIKETGVQLNCTVVLETMRSTFTVEQPVQQNLNDTRILPQKKPTETEEESTPSTNSNSNSNLLTDDDDSIDVAPPETKTPNKKIPVKTKPIFSPYGNSPVKKRVAAFEKLADAPTRVTRTKTRNQAAAATAVLENSPKDNTPIEKQTNRIFTSATTITKPKKHYTPLANNKLPSMIPQSENKLKSAKNASVASDASVKALTAVKASRAELQERREEEQKRKLEHDNEVKRKKEAMLQAKIEEQKRKREEKQLKAQKAREAKEREKEEKIRRIIQEKEEKLQKEEQMKREWANTMAKKAAEEEKVQQMLKQEKLEQKRKLNKKPPPLPTDDLQDTDDEEENPKHKYIGPLWSQRQNLYPKLHTQRIIPNAITKEFFQMQAQTPNLLEIFETVNADILRRNSSAVWRTPPRYSTLPKFN